MAKQMPRRPGPLFWRHYRTQTIVLILGALVMWLLLLLPVILPFLPR